MYFLRDSKCRSTTNQDPAQNLFLWRAFRTRDLISKAEILALTPSPASYLDLFTPNHGSHVIIRDTTELTSALAIYLFGASIPLSTISSRTNDQQKSGNTMLNRKTDTLGHNVSSGEISGREKEV